MNTELLLLAGLMILVFLFKRNQAVLDSCLGVLQFSTADHSLELYEILPNYEAMLFNPKYWLLWTTKHWLGWIERQDGREKVKDV